MKRTYRLLTITAVALATLSVAPAAPADGESRGKTSLDEVYRRGRLAFHTGDLATAKEMFATILKYSPDHTLSRNYLAQIEAAEAARGGNLTLERKMGVTVIDRFEIDDDTIRPTIQYLIRLIEKSSGGSFKPNIVLKGLSEEQKATKMSFSLAKVPASYLLKTVGDMAGVKFTYDKHAIVGTPRQPTATAPSSATAPTNGGP